jgi:hypothetical protein
MASRPSNDWLPGMLAKAAQAGIRLRPGVTVAEVGAALGEFEDMTGGPAPTGLFGRLAGTLGFPPAPPAPKWRLFLAVLGAPNRVTEDGEDVPPLSDDIRHLDTECIETRGSYVAFARHLAALASPLALFDDVQDDVDLEAEVASVILTSNGQSRRLDLKVNADWLDPEIIREMNRMLEGRTDRRFAMHGLEQDFLLICMTEDQITRLNSLMGLNFDTTI